MKQQQKDEENSPFSADFMILIVDIQLYFYNCILNVRCNYLSYISAATIVQLFCIFIKNFSRFKMFREMTINHLEEFLTQYPFSQTLKMTG